MLTDYPSLLLLCDNISSYSFIKSPQAPFIGCGCLYLSESIRGWTARIDSCLHFLELSLSLSGSGASPWAESHIEPVIVQHYLRLYTFPSLCISYRQGRFWSKILWVIFDPIAPVGILPGYRGQPLHVPNPQCCELKLRSPQ